MRIVLLSFFLIGCDEEPPATTPESPEGIADLPRLAACVAPEGGLDGDDIYQGTDDVGPRADRTLSGEVIEVGEGQAADLCFQRAVLGTPGFKEDQDALGTWFRVATDDGTWTVGLLSDAYRSAVVVGDEVEVEMVDGRYGWEGRDYGWLRLTRGEEVLFELLEDDALDGRAATDPAWDWRYAYGETLATEETECGTVRHRALHAEHGGEAGEIRYGGTGTVDGRTVVNSGADERVEATGQCFDWNPGRVLVGSWIAQP